MKKRRTILCFFLAFVMVWTTLASPLSAMASENETEECAHNYETYVNAPTCTEQGSTTYICSLCADSYDSDWVDPVGHEYVDGYCHICGEMDPDYVVEDPISVPVILCQPESVSASSVMDVQFSVTAEGEGLTYQWQEEVGDGSWIDLTDATAFTAALIVTATAEKSGTAYRCVITDMYGNSITSDAAFLKVSIELASGTCGDDLTWSLKSTGALFISGTGNMYDYSTDAAPWAITVTKSAGWLSGTA